VALGFRNSIDLETARAAALDGSIEDLLNWTRVSSGDFLYVPAGTVHAIGAGIKLLEIQQNMDVTYRLYDYGRPRELHLEDALAVAKLHPAHSSFPKTTATETFELLVSSPHFSVLRIGGAAAGADVLLNRGRWIVPLRGSLLTPDGFAEAGDCMFLMPGEGLQGSDDAMFIVAVEGSLL
jgi:mannose-6-phosphate isomerase